MARRTSQTTAEHDSKPSADTVRLAVGVTRPVRPLRDGHAAREVIPSRAQVWSDCEPMADDFSARMVATRECDRDRPDPVVGDLNHSELRCG
jgi:hypothetical protein